MNTATTTDPLSCISFFYDSKFEGDSLTLSFADFVKTHVDALMRAPFEKKTQEPEPAFQVAGDFHNLEWKDVSPDLILEVGMEMSRQVKGALVHFSPHFHLHRSLANRFQYSLENAAKIYYDYFNDLGPGHCETGLIVPTFKVWIFHSAYNGTESRLELMLDIEVTAVEDVMVAEERTIFQLGVAFPNSLKSDH